MSSTKKLRTSPSYIPSSYSGSEPKEYDVFLSFRGEYSRNTFTSHLYHALVGKGISTFTDDDKIRIGKPISPELLLAIEKSSMAVIVLSRNYASSAGCLDELSKIIECRKERKMIVLPIFYHVDPSDVLNQTGTFADAFAEHEIHFEKNEIRLENNSEKVRTWRNALREVASLPGRHLQNGCESEFIQSVVEFISSILINPVDDQKKELINPVDDQKKELVNPVDDQQEELNLFEPYKKKESNLFDHENKLWSSVSALFDCETTLSKPPYIFDFKTSPSPAPSSSSKPQKKELINPVDNQQEELNIYDPYKKVELSLFDNMFGNFETTPSKPPYIFDFKTTPSPAPSSSSKPQWKYEVFLSFLSFRGETRNIFTSHLTYQKENIFTSYLCNELREKFIYTSKDDGRLENGRPIKKELFDAIEKSRMAVIIISKEYASSRWCLEELAKIVECMKDREMKVLPVFYHVDPSDVGKPEDTFRDAFARHEKNIESKDKVQTWRNALKKVANLSGCHLKSSGDEPTFIKEVVKMISRELINLLDDHEDNLVGIDSPVNEILNYFASGSNDVCFIGIVGISGMGKTTLARVIFEKFNHLFQARSFLEDVSFVSKRDGLVALQENLLSDMKLKDDQEKWDVLEGIDVIRKRLGGTKVLIVLDDVDEKEQLETLVGNCNWFGSGSRIIVTTRDEDLLTTQGVQIIYPIKGLHKIEALQLFSQEAFRKRNQCEDQDFLDLCNDYVSYANGHPLTLKVLGSSLLGKGREFWKRSLDILQVPSYDNCLKIGFDALGDTEKKMFLDIACFFNGEDKDRVIDLLEGSDCFPNIDIETLMDKSLISILGKKLRMHSVLQEMGREIVYCEYPESLGKRSRLWHRDDILEVLRENSGTYKVRGMVSSTSSPHQEEDFNPDAFSNMKMLRLMKICDVNLPRGLNSLSNQLRLMEWHKYPLESIPESFQPTNLVELIMHHSRFKELPMAFLKLKKLKVMDFSGSENLEMTPDFSGCPSLQRLNFEGCTSLCKVHPSIGALSQLILLNLKDCKCLCSLPHEIINLESLNRLILSGCSRFEEFPEIGHHNMKHLSDLYLDGTGIERLQFSIQYLTSLTLLNLGGCKMLRIFPNFICCLPALKTLIISGCKAEPSFPSFLPDPSYRTLSLPRIFGGLTSLVALDLSDWNLSDGALPDDLSDLTSLESLNLSGNNFTRLPDSISQLPQLRFLYLDNCRRLQLLPNLPSTILVMTRECTSL